ncbi:TIM44-like domain-containing protein [Thiorhodococcus mannitoliphagus]|uniref:TIM44-like domain-containing protein n=1 Tax=Thiorhodococcus mannitoliphagus TaxID=329406 RepID=A0A6P1DU80_9GAMM|nr:TIM44-like domain-containing protein [Thiorhodococcus mannitoliphagus]NEX19255.1 TIM44-like domain-containing protein [Thiorhodococcus mannitoliphagus]
MKLKSLFTAVMALVAVSFLVLPHEVDAKRFGGGSSLGKQSSSFSRKAQPAPPRQQQSTRTQRPMNGAQPPRPSGASRWLGPLAGLAAGGLLASLFMGDAFEGFQFFDFLLVALLILGAVLLFKMLRRGGSRPMTAAYGHSASGPGYARLAAGAESSMQGGLGSGMMPSGLSDHGSGVAGEDETPAWFDGPGFMEAAKLHFIRLQAAWDHADFRDIREYSTPQLFAELRREREKTEGTQFTEVVRLDAELLGSERDGDLVVASVLFSGLIREDERGVAEQFSEIWHLQHDWDTPDGDWLIAGIQQT